MGDPAADFSDCEPAEQVENGVQTGFDPTEAIVFLEKLAGGWKEVERLDVVLLRALCQLSRGPGAASGDGFTAWDIVEAIGEIRGARWSDPGNKEQMAADVRRQWNRLQELWKAKSEGVEQRFADAGIEVVPRLDKTEGGGTGRPTRYRIEWTGCDGESCVTPPMVAPHRPLQPGEIRYACEDIEDAGALARLFTKGYVNRPGFARHLEALNLRQPGRCHERQALHG